MSAIIAYDSDKRHGFRPLDFFKFVEINQHASFAYCKRSVSPTNFTSGGHLRSNELLELFQMFFCDLHISLVSKVTFYPLNRDVPSNNTNTVMAWRPIYNALRYFRKHGCKILKECRLIMVPPGLSGSTAEKHLDIALQNGYDTSVMMFDVLSCQHGDTQICKTEGRSSAGEKDSPGADTIPGGAVCHIYSKPWK